MKQFRIGLTEVSAKAWEVQSKTGSGLLAPSVGSVARYTPHYFLLGLASPSIDTLPIPFIAVRVEGRIGGTPRQREGPSAHPGARSHTLEYTGGALLILGRVIAIKKSVP